MQNATPYPILTTILKHHSCSFVFTGRGKYISVDESQSPQVNQSTQLLSPLIRGPKCLRFYYYIHGRDDGNLDVFLWPRELQVKHLMWRRSGDQGVTWMKAYVDVGYTGESQVGKETLLGL